MIKPLVCSLSICICRHIQHTYLLAICGKSKTDLSAVQTDDRSVSLVSLSLLSPSSLNHAAGLFRGKSPARPMHGPPHPLGPIPGVGGPPTYMGHNLIVALPTGYRAPNHGGMKHPPPPVISGQKPGARTGRGQTRMDLFPLFSRLSLTRDIWTAEKTPPLSRTSFLWTDILRDVFSFLILSNIIKILQIQLYIEARNDISCHETH